ncbi:PepSY domain-containing protein [Dermatophilus congolensis]|uniref:PepSY domain-containing protein n=1 Tax=Dermatophilus congolensis TaxID=1863 RepID=UPI001AAE506D|nr:PepSY domain-containing protein [Dermatophilus congolensis]MBO3142739.1 hypothetical protein [Dermatophilus congolensis]MBO3151731.1 hypothetical protein [Dermatophilus congolensis]MBO3161268.1 hypothetical protein [Dermatophilus congolensis]MBO3163013.1 hypothetical protein [Dermatophilus congolensis]MBO3176565.1 hypothetical protein [Dermatophilus congolensis]
MTKPLKTVVAGAGVTALASLAIAASTVAGGAANAAPAVNAGQSVTSTAVVRDVADHPIRGSIKAPADRGQSDAAEQAQLQKLAKISLDQARKIAVKAVPGKVVKAELDEEDGWVVYKVEVRSSQGVETDVIVDAGNGRILAQETDTPDDDD